MKPVDGKGPSPVAQFNLYVDSFQDREQLLGSVEFSRFIERQYPKLVYKFIAKEFPGRSTRAILDKGWGYQVVIEDEKH